MTTFIAFVVVFGTIVFVHELGHFLVAKLSGIKVYEFALGFGPAILQRKMGETTYSIRLFPLGGFVKLAGMDQPENAEEEIADDDPHSFGNKSLLVRMGTIAAGPLMNFVLAVALFSIYFMLIVVPPTITMVEQGSVADQAGLAPGDQFVSINEKPVQSTDEIISIISSSPGQELRIEVKRESEKLTIPVTPVATDEGGRLGVGIDEKPQYPLGQSIVAGVTQTVRITQQLVRSIIEMVTGRQEADIAGPIGIIRIVGETAQQGLANLLLLAIILNVNLGLLNLLPVPVLDGGWLLLLVVEGVRGKPLNPELRGVAQFIGLALLILLMVFATFKDIARLNLFS